jgi:hypothetical protein
MLYRLERLFGCPIVASDGEIGLLKDVYFDDARWTARYLVIDTGDCLKGRRVLIPAIAVHSIERERDVVHVRPPQWIKGVDWIEREVNVGVTRDIVEAAPEYHPDLAFSPAYAAELCRHYRRPAAGRPAK